MNRADIGAKAPFLDRWIGLCREPRVNDHQAVNTDYWVVLADTERDSAAHFAGACGVTVSGASSCEVAVGCQVSRCPLKTVLGPRRWCPR